MSSSCEFEQEGFCLAEDYGVEGFRCQFAKGLDGTCTAKPEDLMEYCEDCDMPVTLCKCDESAEGSGRENGEQS